MPNILALDLATKTGWSLSKDGQISGGTWKLKSKAKLPDYYKVVHLYHLIEELNDEAPIDHVVFEEVDFAKFRLAYASYNQLLGVVQLWCAQNEIPLTGVKVKTLKKYATGSGNAGKPEMIAAAAVKWPDTEFEDDNHIDARWLLDYHLTHQ